MSTSKRAVLLGAGHAHLYHLKDWIDRRFLREYQQAAGVTAPPE